MKIIYNKFLPFPGFAAINLFGLLFVKKNVAVNKYMINHELIHTKQMQEMCFLFFYLWYLFEWLIRVMIEVSRRNKCSFRMKLINAYRNISFEREAFSKEFDLKYLGERKFFSWTGYL